MDLGRFRANLGRTWPMSSQAGQPRANFGRARANSSQCWSSLGKLWSNSVAVGPTLLHPGPLFLSLIGPKPVELGPRFGRFKAKLCVLGRSCRKSGHIEPDFGRIWPMSAPFGPCTVATSTGVCPKWANRGGGQFGLRRSHRAPWTHGLQRPRIAAHEWRPGGVAIGGGDPALSPAGGTNRRSRLGFGPTSVPCA